MRARRESLRALTREPLVLLAGLGGLIFALHHALGGGGSVSAPPAEAPIRLDAAYVDGLVAQRRAAGRAVDREAIAAEHLREEVLVRRARGLGLDRGDPIVRRRLAERMELWLASRVDPPEPTDAEVQEALVAARAEAPSASAVLVFEHRFFARSRTSPIADAAAAREAAGPDSEIEAGDAFALGPRITSSQTRLSERFGEEFAVAVAGLEVGVWSAPLESALGVHLVRLLSRRPGTPSAPSEARVRTRLVEEARRAAVERAVARLTEAAPVRRE